MGWNELGYIDIMKGNTVLVVVVEADQQVVFMASDGVDRPAQAAAHAYHQIWR